MQLCFLYPFSLIPIWCHHSCLSFQILSWRGYHLHWGTTMLIGKHWFVFLSTLVISSYIVVEFYSSVSLYSEVQEDFLHACFIFSCFNFVATCINLRAILNIIYHLHSAVNQTCKGQGRKRDQNNICCKRMLFTESIQMNHRFQLWSTFEGAKNNQNLQNF